MPGRGSDWGRLIVGLMSGTSHDGVDAALVRLDPKGHLGRKKAASIDGKPLLIHHHYKPYTKRMMQAVRLAMQGAPASGLTELGFELGAFYAEAANECIRGAGIAQGSVYAVASHGQTIYHRPPSGGRMGATLQIGNPAVIARLTGLVVVSDFRSADVAAGGHGAPLVPYADCVLFASDSGPRAVHNIGGISNLTVVPRGGLPLDDVLAFDTGPGNCLMDEAARLMLGREFDRSGAAACKGRCNEAALTAMMRTPYLSKRPPKSTGRELFGPEFLKRHIRRMKPQDALCTLAHFTAASIAHAYERHVLPSYKIGEVAFSGGGTKNAFLMGLIRERLSGLGIGCILSDELGVPSSAREAMSFAVLANETLSCRPSNVPGATGASMPVALGSITLP